MNRCKKLFALITAVSCLYFTYADSLATASTNEENNSEKTNATVESADLQETKNVYVPEIYDTRLLALSTADYPVTPGDEYQLTYLANTAAVSTQLSLDASYNLRVHNLGSINAKGKTFLQLKTQVESLVSKNYPLSGVQFTLTSPGRFFVTIEGYHPNPGQKTATGLSRLSDLLYEVDIESNPLSSLRNVAVTSEGGQTVVYDFFQTRKTGSLKENPRVKPGDIITISRAQRYVEISGAVYEQGKYQILEKEGVKEVVENFALGLLPSADTEHIQLFRLSTPGKEPGLYKILSYEQLLSEKLETGDQIIVPGKQDLKNVFTLEGAVNGGDATTLQVSGRYVYKFYTGQKLSDVFKDKDLKISLAADYDSCYLVRQGQSTQIDIGKFLFSTDLSQDRELKDGDVLVIPFKYAYVWVTGAVNAPGKYPVHAGKTSEYYIKLAGGYNINSIVGKELIYDADGKRMPKEYVLESESRIDVPSTWFLSFINTYWSNISSIWSIFLGTLSIITQILIWQQNGLFPQK